MAIPKWLLKEAQQDIDAGRVSYDSLGPTAQAALTPPPPIDNSANNQNSANFRDMERTQAEPVSGISNFHQIQDIQNQEIADNAAQYAQKNPSMLNPYIPD